MLQLDPDFLPEVRGTLARFLLNPKADIDGLLLEDGTEVHTPPHLSAQLSQALQPGSTLSVRGIKPRQADVIVAVAIDPNQGPRILDQGPSDHAGKSVCRSDADVHAIECTGTIGALLHGPKGNLHGVLLMDGIIVRFPPHCAAHFAELLKTGSAISARGNAIITAHGTVIDATALGKQPDMCVDIGSAAKPSKHPKPPKPRPRHP